MSFHSTHLSQFPGWQDPNRRDALLLFLFDRFDGLIAPHCARFRVQRTDAEDITQKLWLKPRPKFDEFLARYRHTDRPSSFRAWLTACTRNLIRDLFRDRSKDGGELPPDPPDDQLADAIAADFDECEIADDCLQRAVRQTRERVQPHNWHAFVECALHGRSFI